MGCCTEKPERRSSTSSGSASRSSALDRRELLAGSAGLAGLAMAGGRRAKAQETVKLAFCSQLLCVVPYEFTRAQGLFEAEGLSVELVYTRGGNAAMQALVGGAVDYAATSFDVAVQAFANGAPIRRFATTGRLPLFALAVAPAEAGGDHRPEGAGGQGRRGSRRSGTPITPCCSTSWPRRAPMPARWSSRCWGPTSSRRCAGGRWRRAWCRSRR